MVQTPKTECRKRKKEGKTVAWGDPSEGTLVNQGQKKKKKNQKKKKKKKKKNDDLLVRGMRIGGGGGQETEKRTHLAGRGRAIVVDLRAENLERLQGKLAGPSRDIASMSASDAVQDERDYERERISEKVWAYTVSKRFR